MKASVSGLVLLLLFVAGGWLAVSTLHGPAALSVDAPAERFSAGRALEHLAVIADRPHPVGTAAHEEVRHYLLSELQALGLSPQVQTASLVVRRGRPARAAMVHNVLARLDGSGSGGKAVLLLSHYDSVPGSPGAADDGAGVATVLETLRALGAGDAPENDVIALFTDAEETGLHGAAAFVDRHPWAEEVGVVLNFEARGTRGPVLMFETSPGNGSLVAELGGHVRQPVGSSYSVEIYRRMPNDTDFTMFRRAGLPGLNFAFIGGGGDYHSPEDAVGALAPSTLQQMGDTALDLTRRFGSLNLERPWRHRDAVYFNLFGGRGFVSYPGSLVLPLLGVLVLGVGFVLWTAVRRGHVTVGGLLAGLALLLAAAAVVGLVVRLLGGLLFGAGEIEILGGRPSTGVSLAAAALLAAALIFLVHQLAGRRIGLGNRIAAGLVAWLLFAALLSVVAPGASFLFALPLLVALPAAWLALRGEEAPTENDPDRVSGVLLALLALSTLFAAVLWLPTFSLTAAALYAAAAAAVGALLTLLVLGLLAQPAALVGGRRGWLLVAGFAVLGLVAAALVWTGGGADAVNPRRNSITYVADLDSGEARYYSFDRRPDAWTSQFLAEPERVAPPPFLAVGRPLLSSPAPMADLGGAEIELLDTADGPGGRALDLRVSWPYPVHIARLVLRSEGDLEITAVDNRTIGDGIANEPRPDGTRRPAALRYYAPPAEGIYLTVEVAPQTGFEVEAVAQQLELPHGTAFDHEARPPHLVRASGWLSDSTFVVSKTAIPADAAPAEPPALGGEGAEEGEATAAE